MKLLTKKYLIYLYHGTHVIIKKTLKKKMRKKILKYLKYNWEFIIGKETERIYNKLNKKFNCEIKICNWYMEFV